MTAKFKRLPADVAAHCARLGQPRTVRRGVVLTRQGDLASHAYYVQTGYARVASTSAEGHDVLVTFMGPGDVVGFGAAIGTVDHYVGTATAVEPMDLIVWERTVALQLAHRFPEVHERLEAILVHNLKILMHRVHTVSEGPVTKRLATVLLELMERHGRREKAGIVIKPRLTREDLAGLTGTTLYTASRVLALWQTYGVVSSSRGVVRVTHEARLRALARGRQPAPRD
jgi:CRP-like cAMP-binding protein